MRALSAALLASTLVACDIAANVLKSQPAKWDILSGLALGWALYLLTTQKDGSE